MASHDVPFDPAVQAEIYRRHVDDLHGLRFRANAELNMAASNALTRQIFDFQRVIRRLGWAPRGPKPHIEEPRIA